MTTRLVTAEYVSRLRSTPPFFALLVIQILACTADANPPEVTVKQSEPVVHAAAVTRQAPAGVMVPSGIVPPPGIVFSQTASQQAATSTHVVNVSHNTN